MCWLSVDPVAFPGGARGGGKVPSTREISSLLAVSGAEATGVAPGLI